MKRISTCYPFDRPWSPPEAAQLASVLEATAPKVGNVHPGAAFADMQYGDFLRSAAAIVSVFKKFRELSVGELVLESVRSTRASVGINTNLGMLLLFAPLAKAWSQQIVAEELHAATKVVLGNLTPRDSEAIYEAIRVAKPGGLGEASQHDVNAEPPADLLVAMRYASATDAVAAQYANGFDDLFQRLVPWFDQAIVNGKDAFAAAHEIQVRWLAEERDGLIVRKCGTLIASEVQLMARGVIAAETAEIQLARTSELDSYLRADGHRRNPGTTADLIAATLFVKLLCSA